MIVDYSYDTHQVAISHIGQRSDISSLNLILKRQRSYIEIIQVGSLHHESEVLGLSVILIGPGAPYNIVKMYWILYGNPRNESKSVREKSECGPTYYHIYSCTTLLLRMDIGRYQITSLVQFFHLNGVHAAGF